MGVHVTIRARVPPAWRTLGVNVLADWRAAHAGVAAEANRTRTFHDQTGATAGSIQSSQFQSGHTAIATLSVSTVAGAVWEFGMKQPRNIRYRRKGKTVEVNRDPLPQRLFLRRTMRQARAAFTRALRARLEGL
jgi:hypothetical protein